MPTYEYTCKSCGDNIEVFQSFSAKPLKKHDVCGGDLQKVFHARGVVFKGSGWYAKDSKGSDAPANGSSKTDKSSTSDTGSGSASKSGSETGSKSEKSSSKSKKTSTSSPGSSSSD